MTESLLSMNGWQAFLYTENHRLGLWFHKG